MLGQPRANREVSVRGAPSGTWPLDWAELETLSARLDGLVARQAAAIGRGNMGRYQQLQHEIDEVQSEREEIMSRIFGFVPALVGST